MSLDPAPKDRDTNDRDTAPSLLVAVRASTDRTAVLALRGEVDLATVAELRSALDVSIKIGVHHLILDCADLQFLDASGVGVLAAAHTDLRARCGQLVLRNPSVPVQIVLEASGLGGLLESPFGSRPHWSIATPAVYGSVEG